MIKDTIAAVYTRLKLWSYLLLVTLWLGLLRIILLRLKAGAMTRRMAAISP
jgi:hypothetical protein